MKIADVHADGLSQQCRDLAKSIRRWTIEQSLASQVGHIGSVLSITEIVAVLWAAVMRGYATDQPGRDRFILSKGHAVLAVYCALRWTGVLDKDTFETYCADGSLVAGHPLHKLPGIEFSTGSLGQGLSVACGLAYGLRHRGSEGQVYVLISDGECNEGQIWEAAMFAAQNGLGNLTVIVDRNGSQCMGKTKDILDLADHAKIWRAFGWQAEDVDGHCVDDLLVALSLRSTNLPHVIIAQTILGKGVSFMESQFEWHYRNLSSQQAQQALTEITR